MVVKNIYIARHAYSTSWLPKDEQPLSRTGIPNDLPLSDHGINQSQELAHYLLSVDTRPDIIITSPFYSCVETSQCIAKLLDIPVYLDNGLGNWFSKNSNSEITKPADFDTLNSLFPDVLKDSEHSTNVEPLSDGETKKELFSRCHNFVDTMLQQLNKEHPDISTILLMTHAPVKIAIGLNLLKLEDCDRTIDEDSNVLKASVCSLDRFQSSRFGMEEDEDDDEEDANETVTNGTQPMSDRWIMTMNNNIEYLRDGEERPWYFKKNIDGTENCNENEDVEEDQEETEVVYVSVDLDSGSYKESLSIDKNAIFQNSGLEREHPLIRIGDRLYEGTWQKLLGTELAFPDSASINRKDDGLASESTETADKETDNVRSVRNSRRNKNRNDTAHTEKIYRITDRLTLRGIEPI
ncbi:hypothetical protein C6P45_000992 [Maudiozyma exigua]|uniref:Transcription factor TFIIIC triple barrel domain-containing protein n=1 Tax=Maudiozyma exigua TaxID=34358 RepID=A0A9P6WG77_MAUEX|nr:hypothetical protein C6P45_000992 [Kazachstania exigua]